MIADTLSQQIWVALKMCVAKTDDYPQREASVLESLPRHGLSHVAPAIRDVFTHNGPNGSHLCIVTELLGPSLEFTIAEYHDGGDRLDAKNIVRVAKLLMQAVASIHDAGYAHGGKRITMHDNRLRLMYWTLI